MDALEGLEGLERPLRDLSFLEEYARLYFPGAGLDFDFNPDFPGLLAPDGFYGRIRDLQQVAEKKPAAMPYTGKKKIRPRKERAPDSLAVREISELSRRNVFETVPYVKIEDVRRIFGLKGNFEAYLLCEVFGVNPDAEGNVGFAGMVLSYSKRGNLQRIGKSMYSGREDEESLNCKIWEQIFALLRCDKKETIETILKDARKVMFPEPEDALNELFYKQPQKEDFPGLPESEKVQAYEALRSIRKETGISASYFDLEVLSFELYGNSAAIRKENYVPLKLMEEAIGKIRELGDNFSEWRKKKGIVCLDGFCYKKYSGKGCVWVDENFQQAGAIQKNRLEAIYRGHSLKKISKAS